MAWSGALHQNLLAWQRELWWSWWRLLSLVVWRRMLQHLLGMLEDLLPCLLLLVV